uniref:glutathione synthetase-like isoform X1 n=1 Tax=Anopheles coluzzii TaxID=1518534 RepID=UPI0020FFBD55|nr:glutathione synthetase-like isoform X1 [Anopheles coluzzii]XP_049464569.1 glutathione synthetase-like isoform X1 [Anopheles coluzzii]
MCTPSKTLQSCVPFPLDDALLQEVVEKAKDWAIMHGAAMRSKQDFNPDALLFAPFILTPSSFPRKEFQKAVEMQPLLNELIHAVAHDSQFLLATLSSTEKVDEFTRALIAIYRTVLDEGIAQPLSLGLLRSDLMLETRCDNDCGERARAINAYCCWKQVEINTIASGFGHLGPSSKYLQSYILSELGHREKLVNLPDNKALSGLCDAMVEAWKLQARPSAAILFVVENVTYNICDQRFHEFYIRETYPHVAVVRRTLTQIGEQGRLGPGKELLVGDVEASVVYFRAGYEPGHYFGAGEWDARLLIERSVAIKCPSIQYHLAGTKKVQQALAKPDVLRRFVGDDAPKIEAIRDIFTGLYSLDREEGGDEAVALALADPERYVLKPQREGGGNNVYGADIPAALQAMSSVERSAWILMERIFPPLSTGYMVRPNGPVPPPLVQLVSELGIFGAIIGSKDKVLYNKQIGHMLRTKLSSSNEGGVAAGSGALDSPYLID